MKLEVNRKEFFEDRTIGGMYIDSKWFCYTLEDKDRKLEDSGIKIPKETAIPRGKYKCTISYSNRFHKLMPHILDVPEFTGIRIHPGNTPDDTEGCILIGVRYDPQTHNILDSKIAYNDFYDRLIDGLRVREVWITIS